MASYFFKKDFYLLTKEEVNERLEQDVFSQPEFKQQVKEVSYNLKISEIIVEDVLRHYFTNICYLINTVRKVVTKVNIYGFCSIYIKKGKRV